MEAACVLLADAAVRELERRPLTSAQHSFILYFGLWLGDLLNLEEGEGTQSDEDDRSPVVADVHTDGNNGKVLEEGTGYAGRIFVVADVEGRLTLTVGAAFIPFEFEHPMNDRLTDEAWWDMLETAEPEVPGWTHPVLESSVLPPAYPEDGANGEISLFSPDVELDSYRVMRGETLVVHCHPRPSDITVVADGVVALEISIPAGSGEVFHVPTASLPVGEVTVVLGLWGSADYGVRAVIEGPPPREAGGRGSP